MQILQILCELKLNCNAESIHFDFSTKTFTFAMALRLREMSLKAGLNLSFAISGCEAIRDLQDSKIIGVDIILAPMIESWFALKKYIQAAWKVYNPDERDAMRFRYSIESSTAIKNLDMILKNTPVDAIDSVVVKLNGIVNSSGEIPAEIVLKNVQEALQKIKNAGIKTILAGFNQENLILCKQILEGNENIDMIQCGRIGFLKKKSGLSQLPELFEKTDVLESLLIEEQGSKKLSR